MRLVCGKTIDAQQPTGRQFRAIASCAHEPRAPQPLAQALPVPVLAAHWRNVAKAAKGPSRTGATARLTAWAGRLRRINAIIGGAGGPDTPFGRAIAGIDRKPSRR